MKRCLILLALFASACTSGGDPAASNSAAPTPAPFAPAPTQANLPDTAPAARNGSAAQEAAAPAPIIPKGARFTIFCESFTGDDHVQRAIALKNILMANSRVRGWYVIHKDGQSTIYHGYYATFDAGTAADNAARKEAERAQNDKKMVEALPDPLNRDERLFPRALFVSLDSPDPDAPAEWNLVNSGGAYTVEIAAYTGYERKQLAVESVREARKMNIPAFYWHGPSYSHVCIGVWPASAVVEQSTEQINSIPQGSDVFVDVQGGTIPEEMKNQLLRQGRNVQVVVPKVKIIDATLLETLRAYPEHAVDGEVTMAEVIDPKTKQRTRRPKPSMLVRVPAPDASSDTAMDSSAPPTLIQPNPTRNNLGTRLRGLDQ